MDPDDTTRHVTKFFGFGSNAGLDLTNAATMMDELRLPTQSDVGSAYITTPVTGVGTYEMSGRIRRNVSNSNYGYISFLLVDTSSGSALEIKISGGVSGGPYGRLQVLANGVIQKELPLGALPVLDTFSLVVNVEPAKVTAMLSGFTAATITADVGAPAMARIGFSTYHDVGTTFIAEIAYLRRTGTTP